MSISDKQLIRTAQQIRDQLQLLKAGREKQVQQRLADFIDQLERMHNLQRRLSICQVRSWNAALAIMVSQVEAVLRDIPHYVQEVERSVADCGIKVPSVREVCQELIQAGDEFGDLRYCHDGKVLTVTTEPIELDDVYLGDFEIQLHVSSLAEVRYDNTYRIVALAPHPAASNDVVTHPHVSDERLCPGDAGAAINRALAAGRICDFFLLVRSVLTNYNPDSPYVSLDNWHGTACYECGYVASGDDVYWCECCQHEYCGECSSYCRRCDETTCLSCLENCAVCDDPVCPSCMTTCPECGERLCTTCLEELQCPCNQENEENQDEDNDNTTSDTNREQSGDFDVTREAARATETTVGIDAA